MQALFQLSYGPNDEWNGGIEGIFPFGSMSNNSLLRENPVQVFRGFLIHSFTGLLGDFPLQGRYDALPALFPGIIDSRFSILVGMFDVGPRIRAVFLTNWDSPALAAYIKAERPLLSAKLGSRAGFSIDK